jgi:hypothetical protein
VQVLGVGGEALDELRRGVLHPEAEGVAQLLDRDDGPDGGGEAGDHRKGNELDRAAESGESHGDEDETRHEGRRQEAVHPVLLHDAVDDHHEGAGRSADLHP